MARSESIEPVGSKSEMAAKVQGLQWRDERDGDNPCAWDAGEVEDSMLIATRFNWPVKTKWRVTLIACYG
jgi:hypothetical protein